MHLDQVLERTDQLSKLVPGREAAGWMDGKADMFRYGYSR